MMEAHLMKFIEHVRALDHDSTKESIMTSEYNRIRQQTLALRQEHGLTCEIGALKENVKKNRYKDVLPYDQTRVLLPLTVYENESDYINASFLQSATKDKSYIATQGPLSNTVLDFWRMIWEYNVTVIIMACREIELGKRKCECYWSPVTQTTTFGPFLVSNLKESSPNDEVIVRNLTIKCHDECRLLYQFQYTTWPDHGIPAAPDGILGMMDMVRATQTNPTDPMLIHCSAGCGRTGVICVIDYVHDLLLEKRITADFNIMEIVLEFRKQRSAIVQTKEQYEFVFRTVAQMFERALQTPSNDHHVLSPFPKSNVLVDEYVEPLRLRLKVSPSYDACLSPSVRKSALRARSSHPPSRKMNDTYAVINKAKKGASATLPLHRPGDGHHYDNANLGGPDDPAGPLYSTVKPKNRPPSCQPPDSAPASVSSVYERASPGPPRPNNYELVPAEANPKADEDYEYVPGPLADCIGSSQCAPGGLGFNCRIKRPKGPREPPAEWSRA